ncbi:MAG TPA: M42 family metallopeptidase [Anaerolineae bacterium]|nr:M42 family metallopeptidase [Anaerolineae bacterium]
MEIIPLLKRLSEAHGVSGYEHQVRDLVREEFERHADEVRTDVLGNVIALKRGSGAEPRPSIMLAAHMDEIGLIVSSLEDGFVRFEQVGGYDDRVLLGQEVVIHGRRDLPGIIGARPPHVLPASERDKTVPYDRLLVDPGLAPEELAELVQVGDLVTMKRELVELKGGMVSGKAMDDRASIVAVAVCLEELGRLRHRWDVYAVATVQEEVGLKGAITSAFGLQPDVALAIDVTFGKQPGTPDEHTYELGKGPTIGCGPNFHPRVQEALVNAAKALEMGHHLEPAARPPGTDAYAFQISRQGIPAGLVSIPVRSMHTPVETVAIRDVERAGRLMAAMIGRLDDDWLQTLTWDLGLDDDEE